MKAIHATFIAQENLADEDKIEADLQLAKFMDYMGEMNESIALVKQHVAFSKEEPKSYFKAKIRFQYCLFLKRSLVFNDCQEECNLFIKEYSD